MHCDACANQVAANQSTQIQYAVLYLTHWSMILHNAAMFDSEQAKTIHELTCGRARTPNRPESPNGFNSRMIVCTPLCSIPRQRCRRRAAVLSPAAAPA